MIVILLIGLLLLATAVVLVTRGVIASRLRTADSLGQIGRYGFAGGPEVESPGGMRGFLDSAASDLGQLLTQRLRLFDEERLRKNLVAAGMYRTSPRTIIGYALLCALGLPAIWIWLAVATGTSPKLTILATIFLAFLGWFVPGLVIQRRAEARVHRIDRGM